MLAELHVVDVRSIALFVRGELSDARKFAAAMRWSLEEHYQPLQQLAQRVATVGLGEFAAHIRRVVIDDDHLSIEMASDKIAAWISERLRVSLPKPETTSAITLEVPFKTRRSGKGAWVIQPESQKGSFLDPPPQELTNLIRGIVWRDEYFAGTSAQQIAEREGLDQSHVHRLIRRSLETL